MNSDASKRHKRLLGLSVLFLFMISPPSFLFRPGPTQLTESQYWQQTTLNPSAIDAFIDREKCYSNVLSFFGCMNSIRQLKSAIEDKEFEVEIHPQTDGSWKVIYRETKAPTFKSVKNLLKSLKDEGDDRIQSWQETFKITNRQRLPFNTYAKDLISKGDSADQASLTSVAINAFLTFAKSPHDHILPLQMVLSQSQNQNEEYKGIGVILRPISGHLVVIRTLPDSPAQKAGLTSGDIISHIQGESVASMSISEASQAITRVIGDKVGIKYYRDGKSHFTNVLKTDVVITNVSSHLHKSKSNLWGVVRINSFQKEETCSDVENQLYTLENDDRVDGLVLDMRDNPGGLVDQALCVADLFLPKGLKMLEVKSMNSGESSKIYTSRFHQVTDLPLVVLINAGSASSAEIVSGILRENKRALLAGQRTYGKGTVLSGQPFDRGQFDDIVYYKTFAQFYFPSGRSYHVTGLSPDVEIPSLEAKSATFRESDLPYYNIVKQTGISQSQGQAMYSDHNPYDPADFKTCATQKLTVEEPTLAAAALLGCLAAKKSN